MDVNIAQALHSMLEELDLGHCSVPVCTKLTSALESLRDIAASRD